MSTSLVSVLLLGLLAGGVSCAAVQGGLLAGLVSRQQAATPVAPRGPRGRRPPAPPAAVLGDDLAPVGGFLAGKLVSHTMLGALLGLAGSAVQLGVHVRAMVQLAAGVLIIVMGLGQLGVRGFERVQFTPPASWTRLVRVRARSQSALAPAVLGVSSVLIPCGVTLSVMALAVASGSWWQGALILAVFVVGTAPLFTALGYAAARAKRATGPWRRRLAVATGLLVVAMGAYTLNGGLELTGSPLAAGQFTATLGLFSQDEATDNTTLTDRVSIADGKQTVIVTAAEGGYSPSNLSVTAGLPTTLIVRSHRAQGCVRSFVIPALGVEKILPVNGDTAIDLGVLHAGKLAYSCGMGMYTGKLTVTEKAAS